ncbi:MAG: KH domain-containing protein [Candidatus Blackburnbacteria bacterium]|nr:KH domain-containing protein [Candidatus Blackburnbacteria bacterium]
MNEMQYETLIQEVAQNFLDLVGINGAVRVSGEEDSYRVQVESDEAGILIGRRGETVAALQLVIKQVVYNRVGKNVDKFHLIVNVGDWQERREDVLRSLAMSAVTKVKATNEPCHIYDLSPSERRFVHILLSEDQSVSTESEGEGRDRHLVVKPCE